MIIVKISRKLLKIAVTIVLVCLLGFNFYRYIQDIRSGNTHGLPVCNATQTNRESITAFLTLTNIPVQGYKNIEIFGIGQGHVLKRVQSNSVIQREAEKYLNGIIGIYAKIKAIPDEGYIIRVPLEPPVNVQSKWMKDYGINSVGEVFIIFPERRKPYLLVLDNKLNPFFYEFEENTDELLKILDFYPGSSK